jgi:hypothetical protein
MAATRAFQSTGRCFLGRARMSQRPSGVRRQYGSRSQGSASLALGYSHAVPPGSEKKQSCKFNGIRPRNGVLRTPTHRTRTGTSDGWGTDSSDVGRRSRWMTKTIFRAEPGEPRLGLRSCECPLQSIACSCLLIGRKRSRSCAILRVCPRPRALFLNR